MKNLKLIIAAAIITIAISSCSCKKGLTKCDGSRGVKTNMGVM